MGRNGVILLIVDKSNAVLNDVAGLPVGNMDLNLSWYFELMYPFSDLGTSK